MITSAQMQQWMEHPESLDRESLYEMRTLLARYPYFQLIRLLYLKNLYLLHDPEFGAEMRRAVPYVADRRKLFYLIEGDRYDLRSLKQQPALQLDPDEEPDVDRTLSLIDSFLASAPKEQPQTPQRPFEYTGDYTAYLLTLDDAPVEEEETPAGHDEKESRPAHQRSQSLIDHYLNQDETSQSDSAVLLSPRPEPTQPQSAPNEPAQSKATKEEVVTPSDKHSTLDRGVEQSKQQPQVIPPVPPTTSSATNEVSSLPAEPPADNTIEEGCFTETLARIYIKQHRYEKALEIIKKLNEQIGLNNPKKSIYFADQIRFLEKLIINEKSK